MDISLNNNNENNNKQGRNIFYVLGIVIVLNLLLLYTLRQSFVKQGKSAQHYTQVLDSLKIYSHEAEHYEGEVVENLELTDAKNNKTTLSNVLSKNLYTMIIIEPESPCSSCLEEALRRWSELNEQKPFTQKIELLLISDRSNRHLLSAANLFHLENRVYFTERGGVYKYFKLPPARTIAFFFKQERKIIYADYVHISMMNRYNLFLTKLERVVS